MSMQAEQGIDEQYSADAISVSEAVIVDKEASVIRNVHLVGLKSSNTVKGKRYGYKEVALKEAAPLYEGADVFFAHMTKESTEDRDPRDKVGFVKNVVFKEGKGLFGDINLNSEHPYTPSTLWWARNNPSKLSMSHVATCRYDVKEAAIDKINKVKSVDIVSTGATTDGLFKEGVISDKMAEETEERKLDRIIDTASMLMSEVRWPMGKTLTRAEKALLLVPIIKDLLREIQALSKSTDVKESSMDWNDINLDELKKNKPDLVQIIASEAVKAEQAIQTKISEATKDVPEKAKTKVFVDLVESMIRDGKDVTEIVNDRKTIAVTEAVIAQPNTSTKTDEKPAPKAKVSDDDILKAFA